MRPKIEFAPDYRHFAAVLKNERPARLPIYEHLISPQVMEKVLGQEFASLFNGNSSEVQEFFRQYCRFFFEMTYDVISFEVCITEILPDHGALSGGKPGPIQSRADFERYPWAELPSRFWNLASGQFDALLAALPPGMKAVGGVGNGVFEICEDLVGLEYLPFMQVDDPDLYHDLFVSVGDLMTQLWRHFLTRYSEGFVGCRFGDDLGFKSSLLTNPGTVRQHIIPQYRRIIDLIHHHGKPFLWHSCGCIFDIMEDVVALGIDAKHSNEDAIAPFSRWISQFGDRIGLVGGFDLDFLCQNQPEEIFRAVVQFGRSYRQSARGYALGSGNSIPDFLPIENYLAMVRGAQRIRELEQVG